MKLDKFDKYSIIAILSGIFYIFVKKIVPLNFQYIFGLLTGTIYGINIGRIRKWIHS